MSLGEHIKARREELRLSQEYVAERLGVSRQAVSKWETGKSEPTAANLVGLTQLLEIGLSELVEGKKNEPEPPAKKVPNPILRTNLIKMAICMQTIFLIASLVAIYNYRILTVEVKSGALAAPVLFFIALLAACSVWMASNHRFEPDKARRRKNITIETAYCALQTLLGLLTLRFNMGLVGEALICVVTIVYILYINPKFMGRKLTK